MRVAHTGLLLFIDTVLGRRRSWGSNGTEEVESRLGYQWLMKLISPYTSFTQEANVFHRGKYSKTNHQLWFHSSFSHNESNISYILRRIVICSCCKMIFTGMIIFGLKIAVIYFFQSHVIKYSISSSVQTYCAIFT